MKIYIDSEYKCHTKNDSTLREIETTAFDGKCDAYIAGYRFVPAGESWVRPDGAVFRGEMLAPWRDYGILAEIQAAADNAKTAAETEAQELIGELIEMIYEADLEVIG